MPAPQKLAPESGAHALERAEVTVAPDVVVPFEPTLPAIADRGWPQGRLPRTLTGPLATLTDLILDMPDHERSMAANPDPVRSRAASPTSTARADRSRTSGGSADSSRSSPMLSALRRLLPVRAARTRAA